MIARTAAIAGGDAAHPGASGAGPAASSSAAAGGDGEPGLSLRPTALRLRTRRKIFNQVMMAAAAVTVVFGVVMLIWVLSTLVMRGAGGISLAFFTELPNPPGVPGGGLAHAVVGTAMLTGMAILFGVPVGIAAGVWLAEYGQQSRPARAIRFLADVLMGVPSIVVGVFVYGLVVAPMGHFSALAGAVALAILMLPIVTRTTDEMLRIVPTALREAALALGSPSWKMILHVSMRSALPGITTGVVLAIARVSGETAPLLFTALNTPYWSFNPTQPMGSLNVTLFNYAMSPYADWQQMAWGAALVITASVLALTIVARVVRGKRM